VAEAKSVEDVLRKARELLTTVELGLNALGGRTATPPATGIHNVAVFGRSVTLVLQNLRTLDREGFNEWYAPYVAQMEVDPLFAYFNRLRNEILKRGHRQLSGT
jgi:hypothetical protein